METSIFQLFVHAGFFVKAILFVLAGFSIISWAIILYKYDHLNAASRESELFLTAFESSSDPKGLLEETKMFRASPLVHLFRAAYPAHGPVPREKISRSLRRQEIVETEKLHVYLTFLATTGSTAPFVGLLGTVWGIINAFHSIGAAGSASLAVVAPGIAEALVTTAGGLAAAIPAVMAYNYYLSWIRRITLEMEDFSEQLADLFTAQAS